MAAVSRSLPFLFVPRLVVNPTQSGLNPPHCRDKLPGTITSRPKRHPANLEIETRPPNIREEPSTPPLTRLRIILSSLILTDDDIDIE
ncbi:uncharacterized protein K452DRAFT_150517 [Aplosporella prunicola CBS 121167]|uniref:Uncharacterized protein n=1 Tax=Aplosporella prunicola CBS 121167 TaxID=1176127 RepID=A0A6A6BII2_9PEZI|nr:uncharacterized protein K452DRAFT_150517 [Aplosporella prunicola CBS 121167]KAF2143950.1 hypothetical protein K452DRAFT_150517 [Aplosporella prunicola CBS 121167]